MNCLIIIFAVSFQRWRSRRTGKMSSSKWGAAAICTPSSSKTWRKQRNLSSLCPQVILGRRCIKRSHSYRNFGAITCSWARIDRSNCRSNHFKEITQKKIEKLEKNPMKCTAETNNRYHLVVLIKFLNIYFIYQYFWTLGQL